MSKILRLHILYNPQPPICFHKSHVFKLVYNEEGTGMTQKTKPIDAGLAKLGVLPGGSFVSLCLPHLSESQVQFLPDAWRAHARLCLGTYKASLSPSDLCLLH